MVIRRYKKSNPGHFGVGMDVTATKPNPNYKGYSYLNDKAQVKGAVE